MRSAQGHRVAALSILLIVVASACTPAAGNKAGGPEPARVLRLATIVGEPGSLPALDDLIQTVADESNGNLTIDVVYDVGAEQPDAEQTIVRGVAEGRWDLGIVGTRVFDTLGIHAFAPLTAPLVIDSYPLEAAVVTSDIPTQMLASLTPLGVSGLGVFADGLSKPVGVNQPFLQRRDWRGATFASFRSQGAARSIVSLGAEPSDLWGAPLDEAIAAGDIQGFDKSLRVYSGRTMWRAAPYVTANVNLWPQTEALIGNPAELASLPTDQASLLSGAIQAEITRSPDLADVDQGLVPILCASGTRLEEASAADLLAIRSSIRSVYEALRTDEATSSLFAQIERLKRVTPPGPPLEIPPQCPTATPSGSPSPTQQPTTRITPLDGTWVVSYSRAELVAAHPDPSEVTPDNIGTFYLTFDRGNGWSSPARDAVGPPNPPDWWYEVDGDTVTIHIDEGAGPTTWAYRWSVYGDSLTFQKLGGHEPDCSLQVSEGRCEPTGFVVKPFRRVSG
jgi:TRAP-type C4-dicarboxylate transport system substrate-binding protein